MENFNEWNFIYFFKENYTFYTTKEKKKNKKVYVTEKYTKNMKFNDVLFQNSKIFVKHTQKCVKN